MQRSPFDLLLQKAIAPITIGCAIVVFISVILGKKAAVKRQSITQ